MRLSSLNHLTTRHVFLYHCYFWKSDVILQQACSVFISQATMILSHIFWSLFGDKLALMSYYKSRQMWHHSFSHNSRRISLPLYFLKYRNILAH